MPSLFNLISEKKLLFLISDGVLVDSVGIKTKAYEQMYEEYGSSVVKKCEATTYKMVECQDLKNLSIIMKPT